MFPRGNSLLLRRKLTKPSLMGIGYQLDISQKELHYCSLRCKVKDLVYTLGNVLIVKLVLALYLNSVFTNKIV